MARSLASLSDIFSFTALYLLLLSVSSLLIAVMLILLLIRCQGMKESRIEDNGAEMCAVIQSSANGKFNIEGVDSM